MEGVLMRSPNFWGMAVRAPSGDMNVQAEPFYSVTRKSKVLRLPVIRGFVSLAETLWLGMKALTISTNIALGEEEDLSKKEIAVTLIFGLVLAVLLFLAAPVWGAKGVGLLLGDSIENPLLFNLVEGVIRIGIFMLYLVGITLVSKDIRRFFAYHGAEHKAIKVYERGEDLVPENARNLSNLVVKAVIWPGLQLQKLTTREPTDDQVEVAMASLKKVLTMEDEARIDSKATDKLVI